MGKSFKCIIAKILHALAMNPLSAVVAGFGFGLVICSCARAQPLPQPDQIIGRMRLANDRFMREHADPGLAIVTDRSRPSNIWTRGVYYEGLMSLNGVDPDPRYVAYAVAWAEAHHWGLQGGPATRSADNQCCAQTYIDLYRLDPQPRRISEARASIDAMIASPRRDDWWWADALQMAMPVFAKLGAATGNPDYFARAHEWYARARDGEGAKPGLYDAGEGLWFRDAGFLPPYKEPNGRKCFWSRGNGWVMAALVRTLDAMPDGAPYRGDYVSMLGAMSAAVKAVQRPDGFWNVSLLDPQDFGGRETSGTALFAYAMAWGIRHGVLPRDEYLPVVSRAWNGLATEAEHADGFLGYVQGTGSKPADSQPVGYDRKPNFDDFGVGCFLLAGSEACRLASAPSGGK
jgi:rhamnogalacturonyl hydrolase YesR